MSEQQIPVPETAEQLEKRLDGVMTLIHSQQDRFKRSRSPSARGRLARQLGSLEMARRAIMDKLAALTPDPARS